MQLFGCPHYCIDRAGLNAFGAADAFLLHNQRHLRRLVLAAFAVIGNLAHAQNRCQCARAGIAAWRAALGSGFAARHRLRIRLATVKTALAALGLRQQLVDALDARLKGVLRRRVGLAPLWLSRQSPKRGKPRSTESGILIESAAVFSRAARP